MAEMPTRKGSAVAVAEDQEPARVGDAGPNVMVANGSPATTGSLSVIASRGNNQALEGRISFICDLWESTRGQNRLPARTDLDPAEFHRLWPVTFLLERDQGDNEWYVRFAGAAYGSVYGREITGARVRDLVPESLAPQVLEDLRRCIDAQKPIVNDGETTWPDRGNVYRYQRVLLPYGGDDGDVTHLLGVAAFYNSAGATVF